jgi:hypothetical protein
MSEQETIHVDHSPQTSEETDSLQNGEPLSQVPSEAPWSVFSKNETVVIVMLGSLAAFLSPLTANI